MCVYHVSEAQVDCSCLVIGLHRAVEKVLGMNGEGVVGRCKEM